MISAVSGAITAPGSAIKGTTGRYFFKVPDLSDEQSQAISKASGWPAFIGICRALHDQARRGRTVAIRQDAESGKIGVGIKAIARAMGVAPSTIRRQLTGLERAGLVVVFRPARLTVADGKTGKIISKSKGRTPPALVYLTILDSHLRPAKKGAKCTPSQAPAGAGMGRNLTPTVAPVKAHIAPPSKETKTKEAETAGSLSRPADSAWETGRHSAAGAGHEEVIVTTIAPNEPGAVVTVESTLSRPTTPTGHRRPQEPSGGEPAAAATVNSLQHQDGQETNDSPADGSGMDASLGSMAEELARLTGKTAARQQENASALDRLRNKIDELPPAKKRRTKRLGKKAKAAADAERDLMRIVKEKQAAQSKETKAAAKEAYRQQYRAEKAMAVA